MSEPENQSPEESHAEYTLETVARITHIPAEEIVIYTQSGFVSPLPMGNEPDLLFDEEAIHQLRRLNYFLAEFGMNRAGLKVISSLLEEVERLREEVRFLREK